MTNRYALLQDDYALRGWSDDEHVLVNTRSGEAEEVDDDTWYVLESCDGSCDFDSLAFTPRHRAILDRLIQGGQVVEGRGELAEYQRYRRSVTPRVDSVRWAVTGHCNLKCLHCYMRAPQGDQYEPTYDELMTILDRLEDANVTCIHITGGEPLVRKDLFDIIKEVRRRRFCLHGIYTNGVLVTDEFLQRIKECDINPVFHVSFDGVGTHDHMRGTKGVEEKVLRSIKRIADAGFIVSIVMSLDRRCLQSLPATYEKMKELGVKKFGFARPQPLGCGSSLVDIPSDEEVAAAAEEVIKRWYADGKPFILGAEAFFSGSPETEPKNEKPPFNPNAYACATCRRHPFVSHDGILIPCHGYVDSEYAATFPSLIDHDFETAWNDATYRKVMDVRYCEVIDTNPECASCEYLQRCATGCRFSSVSAGNGLLGKDERACRLWKSGMKQHFIDLAGKEWTHA